MLRTVCWAGAMLLTLLACGDGRRVGLDASTTHDAGSPACDPLDTCVCESDFLEPNDSMGRSTLITKVLSNTGDPNLRIPDLSIHHAVDEDWIAVQLTRAGTDPIVTATVSGVPSSSEYEVGAWYDCDDGTRPTCMIGTFDESELSGGCVGPGAVSFASNCDS